MWRDLFSLGFYKRSQGRIARQVTFIVLAYRVAGCLVIAGLYGWQGAAAYELAFGRQAAGGGEAAGGNKATYDAVNGYGRYLLPMFLVFGGFWLAFRAVNIPWFADFLIAVEAEMNKVSWPSRAEMFRTTLVVILTIFGLAFVLFSYDLIWRTC